MIKKMLTSVILMASFMLPLSAQQLADHFEGITLYKEYSKAIVTQENGKVGQVSKANIFLKNGSLLFYRGKDVIEADMMTIRSVKFGDTEFVKNGSKLVEVVHRQPNGNMLVLQRLINVENLKREMLNNSTISNIEMGDLLGITRMDNYETLQFPVDNNYYFCVNGKYVQCGEREVKHAAGKKRIEKYESITKSYDFRWNDAESLKTLLGIFD